ncbi:MAG TPA: protein translocase subunit SecDF [Planctomycetaceae bacterium]|nr:protein translocase subunit SecDF [Planctomycetaceae bacterium]
MLRRRSRMNLMKSERDRSVSGFTMNRRAGSGMMDRWWALACVPALCLVMAVAGCSDTDPMIKLRRAGAVIEQDDERVKIERVVLSKSATPDQLDEQLEDLARVPRVLMLDLSGTQVQDEQVQRLAELHELQTLDLSDTAVTDKGLEVLVSLTSLRKLTLSNTGVTDKGLIDHIPGFPALETLEISPSRKPERESGAVEDGGVLEKVFSGIKLGIDLAGGANLILEVDQKKLAEQEKELTPDVMSQMATSINKRANPGGNKELTVRPLGTNRIEVIIPKADPQVVEQTKRMMTRLGSLELAILANRRDVKFQDLVKRAEELPDDKTRVITEVPQADGSRRSRVDGAWLPISEDGRDVQNSPNQLVFKKRPNLQGQSVDHVLVSYEDENLRVTGENLNNVYQTNDENGRLAVGFRLNIIGATKFGELTGANEPDRSSGFYRHLAIILDGEVFSAPTLNERISGSGQISGDFTGEEINELIGVLKAGALEVPLKKEPVSELTISPTLGSDVQKKGVAAIGIASIAVVVFMIGYYRFSGIVAVICLLLNLVLVMGMMIFIEATFTLPGLAGLVLTIGMAVDANVLIFERIREEQRRGGTVRMAIQNGFGRAFTTIVDANVTTLLVAVVLYMIGTDQVRGFAVTLFIGIVMSMFTALYVGRLLFDIWERRKRREQLKMNSLPGIAGREFNFVGRRRIAAVVSLLVIVCGMASVVKRGLSNFDIDFRGGRAVSFELRKSPVEATAEDIREKLAAVDKDNELSDSMSLEELTGIEGEDQDTSTDGRRRFRLRTTTTEDGSAETDSVNEKIQNWIDMAFKQDAEYELTTMSVTSEPESKIDDQSDADYHTGHEVRVSLVSDDKVQRENARAYVADALAAVRGGDSSQAELDFEIRAADDPGEPGAAVATKWAIRFKKGVLRDQVKKTIATMTETIDGKPQFDEVTSFASAVANEMRQSAVLAMLFSLIAIVGYIWFRFQRIDFGLAAVVALVHDVLVVLGGVALAGLAAEEMGLDGGVLQLQDFKINLPMIAAFLTIVGYSLNDTIVVFDRIREVRGKNPSLTPEMVNLSLNQTLSRTLLTSVTTLIVVVILYFGGGDGIHGFAYCLVLGVVVGTYSSIFVASPTLLWMMNPDSAFNRLVGGISGNSGTASRQRTAPQS